MSDGEAPYPVTLWLADLMDHFPGRLPSELIAEIERMPVGFVQEVVEARAYRQAKHITDAVDTPEAAQRLPTTPLFQKVREIEEALVLEAMEAEHA